MYKDGSDLRVPGCSTITRYHDAVVGGTHPKYWVAPSLALSPGPWLGAGQTAGGGSPAAPLQPD